MRLLLGRGGTFGGAGSSSTLGPGRGSSFSTVKVVSSADEGGSGPDRRRGLGADGAKGTRQE